jgi:hypothetical protein
MTTTPLRRLLTLLIPGLLAVLAAPASAQLRVEIKISRRMYMAYEPVLVTVAVTNIAGRDVTLRDEGSNTWFGFQITDGDEHIIAPYNPNYHLDPLTIPAGQTMKRRVSLGTLFPIAEYGVYHIKATIYMADTSRYFVSPPDNIEISEGKIIWRQEVGVPEGSPGSGETHVISLLTFRHPDANFLYARIENPGAGKILGTYAIGRMIAAFPPAIELDRDNIVHVLQVVGPKTYLYSRVSALGEFFEQKTFIEVKSRPRLVHSSAGSVEVKGGQIDIPVQQQQGAKPGPKLSDRPPGMPAD